MSSGLLLEAERGPARRGYLSLHTNPLLTFLAADLQPLALIDQYLQLLMASFFIRGTVSNAIIEIVILSNQGRKPEWRMFTLVIRVSSLAESIKRRQSSQMSPSTARFEGRKEILEETFDSVCLPF